MNESIDISLVWKINNRRGNKRERQMMVESIDLPLVWKDQ